MILRNSEHSSLHSVAIWSVAATAHLLLGLPSRERSGFTRTSTLAQMSGVTLHTGQEQWTARGNRVYNKVSIVKVYLAFDAFKGAA